MDQRFFFQYVKVIIVAEYGLDLADTYRLGSTLRALKSNESNFLISQELNFFKAIVKLVP